jgi:hypothetical protein
MSAWMVSDNHINALINFELRSKFSSIRDPQAIGQLLVDQNVRSLVARYGKVDGQRAAHTFKFTDTPPLAPVIILKQCDCYDYQAGETKDYQRTKAAKVIARIRSAAIDALPGYDDAPWGID